MEVILGYILTYTYLILVLTGVSLIQKKLRFNSDISRKLIHILVGFSWIIMTHYFKTSVHLIVPPLTFIVINYIIYKRDLLISMKNEKSKGTIYYALSFTILSIITVLKPDFLPFYGIGVFSMCIGDGLAPIVSKKHNKYKIGKSNKTYIGSITICLSSFIVLLVFSKFYYLEIKLIKIIFLSLCSAILELVGKEFDNITLPIGLSVITYLIRSL